MIPRRSRLPYKEFHARGYRVAATPYFSIRARRNTLKVNRFGVVAGLSSAKSAAHRNLWRRQIKSALLKIPQGGFDVLVVLRQRADLVSKEVFLKMLNATVNSLISSL